MHWKSIGGLLLVAVVGLGTANPSGANENESLRVLLKRLDEANAAANFQEGERLAKQILQTAKSQFGEDNARYAAALSIAAGQFTKSGQPGAAVPLYKQALEIRERTLGPEHPDVAWSLIGLADSTCDAAAKTGDQQAACSASVSLYERALAINEKAHGTEHINVAHILSKLGGAYITLDSYGDAIPPLRRSLAIVEAELGSDNPELASVLQNLGRAYTNTGEIEPAIAALTRSIELEPEEPRSYLLRGEAYLNRGEFDLALADYEKASQIDPDGSSYWRDQLRDWVEYLEEIQTENDYSNWTNLPLKGHGR